MKPFKVGDTVYDSVKYPGQVGEVLRTDRSGDYKMEVKFGGTNASYTEDGRYNVSDTPTLSHQPYEFNINYPKVMYIGGSPLTHPLPVDCPKRLVFMEKDGRYFYWANVLCEEDRRGNESVFSANYALDVDFTPQVVEMTINEIGQKLGIDPSLLRIKE